MRDFIDNIFEATLGDLKKAQKGIDKLFPEFYDRVDTVRMKGGIRLKEMKKGEWHFQVHSGTDDSKWYDVVVTWKGVPEVIGFAAKDPNVWKKGKTGVNLRKMADIALYNVDVQVRCSCPADIFYGGFYKRSQKDLDALVPPPEDRFPIVRNPKLRGAFCKHIQLIMNLLPLYGGTFAKFLKTYYLDDIVRVERGARKAAFGKGEAEGEVK